MQTMQTKSFSRVRIATLAAAVIEAEDSLRPGRRHYRGELAQGLGALGMTQISEIVKKPGADFVGPFPAELQNYTGVTVGIPAGAEPSEAVSALIAFLRSPTAVAALKERGMEVE